MLRAAEAFDRGDLEGSRHHMNIAMHVTATARRFLCIDPPLPGEIIPALGADHG
jgi:DNA-binding transcriptional regulator PaaX